MKRKNNRQTDQRPEIISKCLDILAETHPETYAKSFSNVIDTLSDYPKPREKNEETDTEPAPETLGAFLYVSNTRNAMKLGIITYYTPQQAQTAGVENLTNALKLVF